MNKEINKYKEELSKTSKALKDCQLNLQLKSCLNCEKLFQCEIRKKYIDAVYNSMSKGQSGGFEF